MADFKRPLQVIIDHDDLTELLSDQLCSFVTPFKNLHVSLIEKQPDGSWKLWLDRKPKIAAVVQKAA